MLQFNKKYAEKEEQVYRYEVLLFKNRIICVVEYYRGKDRPVVDQQKKIT